MLVKPVITNRRIRKVFDDPPVQPPDIGLPEKFSHWRTAQWDAIERIVDPAKRFTIICAPTGMGKTPLAFAAARLTGKRTCILTSTKGLQDQVREDFRALSTDIRGLNNYLCPDWRNLEIPATTPVDAAPCQCGYRCPLRFGGCEYFETYRRAQRADIFVTNYACWMYDGRAEKGNGDLQYGMLPSGLDIEEEMELREKQKVRILVCDEAHDCPEWVSDFIGVEVTRKECFGLRMDWPDAGESMDYWVDWATLWLGQIAGRISSAEQQVKQRGGKGWVKELKHLRDMKRKLDRLVDMRAEDEWIMSEDKGEEGNQKYRSSQLWSVRFVPLSVARYSESALFRQTEKVVLVSATVRPKTAELLGIPTADLEFVEYDSSFDVKRRPIISVPTARMSYKAEQSDELMEYLLRKIDTVIDRRLDRKGIIHAVSYARAKFLYDNSSHRDIMLVHDIKNRAEVVDEFKRSKAPRVLISPSVDTGYDFRHDEARYQIIVKIPFASVRDAVVRERQKRDREYGKYLAAQILVQMTGRAMRSEDDWSEQIILDAQAEWFVPSVRKFMPGWWMDAYRVEDVLPAPLDFGAPIVRADESSSMTSSAGNGAEIGAEPASPSTSPNRACIALQFKLYQVTLPGSACFGIEVASNNTVQKAAPIGSWMLGVSMDRVRKWVQGKGGGIEEVIA